MSLKIYEIHRKMEYKESKKGKPIVSVAKEAGPLLPESLVMGGCRPPTDIPAKPSEFRYDKERKLVTCSVCSPAD